jgi:hypothetical protein
MEFFSLFPTGPFAFLYFSSALSSIMISQPAQQVSSHSEAMH